MHILVDLLAGRARVRKGKGVRRAESQPDLLEAAGGEASRSDVLSSLS